MKTFLAQLLAFALASAALPGFAQDSTPASVPPEAESTTWLTRDRLTGDWGGRRTTLAEKGVTLDLGLTQFGQGLVAGDGSHDFEYGGKLDGFVNLDTGKLGLWEGGGLRTHLEYRYGELETFRGGALWPANTAMVLPLGTTKEVVASSIYLTQRIGDRASVMLGKINVIDLLAGDSFFGGWGTQRFMNVAFVAPPSGVLPPVIMGTIANVKTAPIAWTLMVYDPNDHTTDYGPNDLFADGVNVSLSATYAGKLADRITTCSVGAIYSTKDRDDLREQLLPPDLKTQTKNGAYSVSFQVGHFLVEHSARPGDGWGVFVKAAIGDGNPNPIRGFVIGGFGGKGLFPGRPNDGFGLGYYYYNFSDDLQKAVSPVVTFHDEHGIEAFYNFAATPWLGISPDLQVVRPANGARDWATVLGLRMHTAF